MIRVAAALLTVALLSPTTATAAGETCQGQPATLVGSMDDLVGTEGPDVIVTNGARRVDALGGDDLVCVTSSTAQVFTGAGDDVVEALEAKEYASFVELGPGSDRYTGSAGHDVVRGGSMDGKVHVDAERDVIDTGSAEDDYADSATSGQTGSPNPDEVHMSGGTLIFSGTPTPQTVLTGGGTGRLRVVTTGEAVVIDAVTGTYALGGATASASGFVAYLMSGSATGVEFRGSSRDEHLGMAMTGNPVYAVDLADGDDEVVIETDRMNRSATTLTGGDGRDLVGVVLPGSRNALLDLASGRLSAMRPERTVFAAVRGFEDASVVARRAEVRGSGRDNDLRVRACAASVRARGGDDLVSADTELHVGQLPCSRGRARFYGGAGRDVLRGDTGPDVLVGGPGRDVARGGPGRDTCSAETVTCEVRR